MVYQDYELVATKRVGHSRSKGSLWRKATFNAMGGFNTVYMMSFMGVAGTTFGLTSSVPLAKPLLSVGGVSSIARNSVLAGGPVILGFIAGVSALGNG